MDSAPTKPESAPVLNASLSPDKIRQASNGSSSSSSSSPSPALSRSPSYSGSMNEQDELDELPPLDRLTIFDILGNLSLSQQLERLQSSISVQKEKVKRQQQRLKSGGLSAKDKVVDEWRKRMLTPEEQLSKYKRRMQQSVDRMQRKWTDSTAITFREKASFIAGVLNVFISGYLIGAYPEWFHIWFTAQLCYFMPVRYYTYHKKGYHYFLADLCYFVNLLALLSIWAFPQSKRLFISTYCLAMGNNAIAIAMWRNSMVFHSLDKVTSLFIHIMPCVTLHCLVHLLPPSEQAARFPAIYHIKYSSPSSPQHYSLTDMVVWASVPYAVWQLTYHFFITVRRREKIAAGRPTSFTWLRKSYAPTLLGKMVLSLPENLHEPAFMLIQYAYALSTMVPCPIWFWHRWLSAGFLLGLFCWSVYNGATFYIDVFGRKFEKELEQLRREMQRWQSSSGEGSVVTPGVEKPQEEVEAQASSGRRQGRDDGIEAISSLYKERDAGLVDGRSTGSDVDASALRRKEHVTLR